MQAIWVKGKYAIIECLLPDEPLSTYDVLNISLYLSAAVCISGEIDLDPCRQRDILRVKGQTKSQNATFSVREINTHSLNGHYLRCLNCMHFAHRP